MHGDFTEARRRRSQTRSSGRATGVRAGIHEDPPPSGLPVTKLFFLTRALPSRLATSARPCPGSRRAPRCWTPSAHRRPKSASVVAPALFPPYPTRPVRRRELERLTVRHPYVAPN